MKIGFIGVGAMAKAMIQGIINAGHIDANDIFVHAPHLNKYEEFADKYGISKCDSNLEVVKNSDVVVLAVGANNTIEALKEVRDAFTNGKILVSIVWQVTLNRLQELTNYDLPIMRMIPNVNVAQNEGMMVYHNNENVDESIEKQLNDTFNPLGKMMLIPEDKFDVSGSLIGCTPAYAYLFADILSRSAVNYGLDKKQATEMAAQAILGSMKMVETSSKSPSDLIDDVCSPNGGTIKGLMELKKNGFEKSVINCFDATQRKEK